MVDLPLHSFGSLISLVPHCPSDEITLRWLGHFSQVSTCGPYYLFVISLQRKSANMGEENYIYHYVNLPNMHLRELTTETVHLTQPDGIHQESIEMINILTPIINVDDKKTLFNQALIKAEVNYDVIIHQEKPAELELELNLPKEDNTMPDPESEFKRSERLQKDIIRKKMARLRESDEQRVERLKKDRVRKKRARLNETTEQRQKRLEKDRLRIQKRRALETDEERQRRLEKNRISKRKARLKENSRILC